ncbi:MAG: glycosyltransferase family 2 protein [Ignisphaera sp.]
MRVPMVSILWVNYNSMENIRLVLESLQGIKDLDYPNYELICVDNCSTDGSYQVIKEFLGKMRNAKLIRLERNIGFTGGNNAAYRARSPESKYVVLLNNDAMPYPESLKKMVEVMESCSQLGGSQGIILDYRSGLIDTAGDYISELLSVHPLFSKKHYSIMKKPVYVTYADGSYSIYRVNAIKKAVGHNDKLFDEYMFAYYDDSILGLKLWSSGYKVASYPFLAARHQRSTSFKKVKQLQYYLNLRGRIVLNTISNSRYKNLVDFLFFRSVLLGIISHRNERLQRMIIRAYIDGKKIGEMKKLNGEKINLYNAPIIKVNVPGSFLGIILPRRFINTLINEELEKNWLASHRVKAVKALY